MLDGRVICIISKLISEMEEGLSEFLEKKKANKKIKELLPNAYIYNLDGKVIKE